MFLERFYITVVVQVARLGDLVQTWRLVSRLVRQNGPDGTALIADEGLADVAALMVGSGNVLGIPMTELRKNFRSKNITAGWRDAALIGKTLKSIRADRVINLNFHAPAAALAEAILTSGHYGARWSDVREGIPSDPQLTALFEASSGLRHGEKHLSDVWSEYAGEVSSDETYSPVVLPPDVIDSGRYLLKSAGIGATVKPVAVIIGSGLAARSLTVEQLRRITCGISEVAPVVMIGTEGETRIANQVLPTTDVGSHRIVSLCGATGDLLELAGVLSCCSQIVGVDTGALHLAALVGTRCLGIYFGSMNFRETGPYGEDHIVVTPNDPTYPCHEMEMERSPGRFESSIDPAIIVKIARGLLNAEGQEYQPSLTAGVSTDNVNVYRSLVGQDGLGWEPINVFTRRIPEVLSSTNA